MNDERSSTSPYASGGGGVTFERKVGAQYLAHLLAGDAAPELGPGRRVVRVDFQQAPVYAVDDLVVRAARHGEGEASLVLALAIRRSPKLVQSDEKSRKLIQQFVKMIVEAPSDGPEQRLGLVVAGRQRPALQLRELAHHAAGQSDAASFFDLFGTPGTFSADSRRRLCQFVKLVEHALRRAAPAGLDDALVQQRTWELLSVLTVLTPELESPGETDWFGIATSLVPVVRDEDLDDAMRLLDRLLVLAGEYAPKAARVDLKRLRRDAHSLLDTDAQRNRRGWTHLNHLHEQALASVRHEITSADRGRSLSLERGDAAKELDKAAGEAAAVVVTGESGVGKSALAVQAFAPAPVAGPEALQALCINLRQVPALTVEFEALLGLPLSTLLGELGAPRRVLVVDGVDAVAEGRSEAFNYLLDAASQSDVKVVAVTSLATEQMVLDALAHRFGEDIRKHRVGPLADIEINQIVETFPEVEKLGADPRSRGILRRLVVVDLLVRASGSSVPLTDADAMNDVWARLVRGPERTNRGSPDARVSVMLRLADLELTGGDRLAAISGLDPEALEGLRRDGLLRTSPEDPFGIGPEFAHDELRRYAVARLLLLDDVPTTALSRAGAPRWSLSAAQLACQAWLGRPATAERPSLGRFHYLQRSFDALVQDGLGARWGDVPGEALLKQADPSALLRDAWDELRADDSAGLKRLVRLVDQRLRDDNRVVDIAAVEPIIELLLDEPAPWRLGDYVNDLLRAWLRAHVIAGSAAGHPLRILLRERLVVACAAADQALAEKQAAETSANRGPETGETRSSEQTHSSLPRGVGPGDHTGFRRARLRLPQEITDPLVLELLALLGPDLDESSEKVLQRVAREAPGWLGPAVEEPFTGFALASYRRGFLAELTGAYYFDDSANAFGLPDDGIRSHRSRTADLLTPLASWSRGPFTALFQSDFSRGVAVLNRLLNHAARVRARSLAHSDQRSGESDSDAFGPYWTTLETTGSSRRYIGDEHVWLWYRGTGVGPYPCFSALQALERECDQLIQQGTPIEVLVAVLLKDCENLAMVGLVVGLLVRHLEKVDGALDPYFASPLIWELEFSRVAHEFGGLAANSEGLVAPERRKWSLRNAAVLAALRAADDRGATLREVGERLVSNARWRLDSADGDQPPGGYAGLGNTADMTAVRAWASSLNPDNLEIHEASEGFQVTAKPPEDVLRDLEEANEDRERGEEMTRLFLRYHVEPRKGAVEAPGAEELEEHVAAARELLRSPPKSVVHEPVDVAAMVAGAVLEAHVVRGLDLTPDTMAFAVDCLLQVGERVPRPRPYEFEGTFYEVAADRSAARFLPLLLVPCAAPLRRAIDGRGGPPTMKRAVMALSNLVRAVPDETRLHLARGLDHVWRAPCSTDGLCHHRVAWHLTTETMRGCIPGRWNPHFGLLRLLTPGKPIEEALVRTDSASIHVARLDAAIRALAPAVVGENCMSKRAAKLLQNALDAQRQRLLSHPHPDLDDRDSHTLVSARSLLTLAEHGDDSAIYTHLSAYADSSELLNKVLRGLSAAGEETEGRAATARRVWPSIVRHVFELEEVGHAPFSGDFYSGSALAALLPNAASDVHYLYRELEGKPIPWWDPLSLRPEVETWLGAAEGRRECIDQLVGFLRVLPHREQVRTGLAWVRRLVLANPEAGALTYTLSNWLIAARNEAAADRSLERHWQETVDALVVAGVTQLAPYSE